MMNIGIDAGDMLNERRGAARSLQSLLAAFSADARAHLTLLCASELVDLFNSQYAHGAISVADYKSARRDAYDVVWYPWNVAHFPTRSPRVATIQDTLAYTAPSKNFFTRRREKLQLRRTAREVDQIIAYSTTAAHGISELLDIDESAITVIRPVPDASWHAALDPLPFSDLADMPYVLCVMGERGSQNLDLFFDAFARAFKKRDVRLVLCGAVPAKAERLFAKILHRRALTPDRHELRALYRNAAAVALPAVQDDCGFTAVEAAACGAAVLAANAGAFPELIGSSSLIVDGKNRREWIDALQDVLDDTALNAKLRAQAVSHWNNVSRTEQIDAYLDVFHRAATQEH